MDPTGVDFDGETVELEFEDRSAVRGFIEEGREREAFMLPLPEKVTPFAACTFLLKTDDGFEFRFETTAVHAFDENESMFDVDKWRYGTGVGVQWFSPFGPLQAFVGLPLDALEVEESPVFEFSVGGASF